MLASFIEIFFSISLFFGVAILGTWCYAKSDF